MIIKNARFLKSESAKSKDFSGFGVPEIAVVGRSNVGKSSFINMLANHKGLAKTSSTPGRTRLVNYFMFNEEFVLVDLPGYGYAKADKGEQRSWESMITGYFAESDYLAGIVMLVDIRHTPSAGDVQMLNYLSTYNIPVIIAATKLDKIKKSEMEARRTDLSRELKVGRADIIFTSSATREGKEKILAKIEQLLENFKGEGA